MGCKEELCRLVSLEGLLLCPQWAAECTSNREIKANQCRTFGFLCLCHGKVHHEFPSPPVHAQPCPELTPPLLQHHCQVLTGKVPMGARPLGAGTSWVLGRLGAYGLHCTLHQIPPGWWGCPHGGGREGMEDTPKPSGKWGPPCWFWVSCPTCQWGTGWVTTSWGRWGGKVGMWEPTLARGQEWPSGVMCSWILFKSVRREDSSEHWINSTFSLSLSLFLLGK